MEVSQVEKLAMNAGSPLQVTLRVHWKIFAKSLSRESQSAISQTEAEERAFDSLAQNVLCASSQIFPSIERPTTGRSIEGLTVQELTIDTKPDTTSSSRVVCPRARIYERSKKIRRSVKFHCCCDDAPHKSQLDYKVLPGKSLLREEIGLDAFRQWSILLLRSNKPVVVRLLDVPLLYHSRVQRLADDIGMAYLTDQDTSTIKPDRQTNSSRFECFQTYDKTGEEREECNVHFGFDERKEAECFAHYLKVAQETLFEKFMRGPFYNEKVVYLRNLRTSTIDETPARMQFSIVSRDLGDSKYAYRTILTQDNATRCICFDFKSKPSDVKRWDLLQSRIWVYDEDANGKPYISQTDWDTLTGQSVVKSVEGATFVKGGHERTANDWLEELDRLFRVMKPDRKDRYKKVKIAVIDSGLNDKVKSRYMAQNNIVYKDFTHETRNDSWHGTCCAKIICDMYEEVTLYVARIFEKDHAGEKEGPIRMAKAIDWAISQPNCVDIISISAGFRDYSKELDQAVTRAKAAGTLVIAAAANWANTGTVAFPARHNLTTMCIYSTNTSNQSSSFNPEPRSDTYNFALLGEEFQHPDQKSGPMSGTSMATVAAAGLAANIIDFSRQEDNKSYIWRSQDVGTLPGMLSIFSSISRSAGSVRYVAPLDLLPANHGSNRERGRQRVREILSQAMERAN
ncbi:hypothetical protein FSPOR_3339 [Fusarium sporotrichioides]|uniref:Peptidase S8/S53 domain-containing protein n=1 Tax=Fusarium sporotrichioides TaxID=5514 RepID=A0A395SH37_FUSSP|nr:hypothetical protein FSPOR_3339 [Fusarium sporotrichioides]